MKIGQYIKQKLEEVGEELEAFQESFEELLTEEGELTEDMSFEEFDGMFAQFLSPEEGAEGEEVEEETPVAQVEAPVIVAPEAPVAAPAPALKVDPVEEAKLEAAIAGNKVETPAVELSAEDKKKLKAQREQDFRNKNKSKNKPNEATK